MKWIRDKNPNYVRRLELVAGNNPGARFVVMHRPIEEVAESWEAIAEAPSDHWNLALRNTRRFVGNSSAPRILVINYHDFLHRTDCVIPLVSRFLELELDKFVTRAWADMILEFQ